MATLTRADKTELSLLETTTQLTLIKKSKNKEVQAFLLEKADMKLCLAVALFGAEFGPEKLYNYTDRAISIIGVNNPGIEREVDALINTLLFPKENPILSRDNTQILLLKFITKCQTKWDENRKNLEYRKRLARTIYRGILLSDSTIDIARLDDGGYNLDIYTRAIEISLEYGKQEDIYDVILESPMPDVYMAKFIYKFREYSKKAVSSYEKSSYNSQCQELIALSKTPLIHILGELDTTLINVSSSERIEEVSAMVGIESSLTYGEKAAILHRVVCFANERYENDFFEKVILAESSGDAESIKIQRLVLQKLIDKSDTYKSNEFIARLIKCSNLDESLRAMAKKALPDCMEAKIEKTESISRFL